MREISSLAEATAWANAEPRTPAAFRDLDLRGADGFESGRFDHCLFLSCDLTPAQAGFLTANGATVIRDDPGLPYTLYRKELYTPEELYAGFDPADPTSYRETFDAVVYRHWVASGRQFPTSIAEAMARAMHDFSISEAFNDALAGQRPVAIMGGHGLERADPLYRRIAELARHLARDGFLMLSGGGPGAMEATHLGVWFAQRDDAELDAALAILGPRPALADGTPPPPGREYADSDWLARAQAVRARWPLPVGHAESIGIPTWAYGHEPPAPFATQIAKYFANSIREDGLLAAATHGVVFAPGSAGTVQEVFQDLAQNHYASFGPPSPMILLGETYWRETLPVWPLMQSLANERDYQRLLIITDSSDDVVALINAYRRIDG